MSLAVPLQLAAIYGDKQIGEIVKDFDFSKVTTTDSQKKDYLTTGIAPSFGTLTSETIKTMDEELKIMIAGTTRQIAKIPVADRNFEKLVSVMMQNPLLEPTDLAAVHHSDTFQKNGTNAFKFDGSPDSSIVREVAQWFDNLIQDTDVLQSTQIDINVLGKIVAQSGATIDSFETLFVKDESHEWEVLDIGVLRYPDLDHPYFKLFRIYLRAWSRSQRILFVQEDNNGITGDFQSRNFKPRQSTMDGISAEVRKKAVAEAEALFD